MEVMSMDFVHPTEELLEEYCFNRVAEPTLAVLEEHLLGCEVCRLEVEGLDAYIVRMKLALCQEASPAHSAARARREGSIRPSFQDWLGLPARLRLPRMVGVGVAALVVLIAGSLFWSNWVGSNLVWQNFAWQKPPSKPGTFELAALHPTVVELKALRGGMDLDPIAGNNSASAGIKSEADPGRFNRAPAGTPLQLRVEQAALPNLSGPRLQVVDTLGRELWSGNATVDNEYLSARIQESLRAGRYWVRLYSGSGELVREFALRLD